MSKIIAKIEAVRGNLVAQIAALIGDFVDVAQYRIPDVNVCLVENEMTGRVYVCDIDDVDHSIEIIHANWITRPTTRDETALAGRVLDGFVAKIKSHEENQKIRKKMVAKYLQTRI